MVGVTPGWGEPRIYVSFMLHLMWSCYQIYVHLMCYILCWILCVPRLSFVCMKCYVLCCDLCIKLCAPNMLDPMLHLLWTKSCLRPQPNVFLFDRSPWIGRTTNIGESLSYGHIWCISSLFCSISVYVRLSFARY